jgi:hypothetical protein
MSVCFLNIFQETVEDIDKNKDGFVDIAEYIGKWLNLTNINVSNCLGDMYRPEDYPELAGKEPDWVQSERQMFSEHRDKDGDGKLNQAEMRDWIMPLGFDHADAEAKHLLGIADDNKVSILSNTLYWIVGFSRMESCQKMK